MSKQDEHFDEEGAANPFASDLEPKSHWLNAESMLFALAEIDEQDRREILYSLTPHAIALLVEMLAANCTAHVEAQATLAPNIEQWAREMRLL